MVTIIIPSYNSELFIERCLESVFKQTFNDIEVIVIDDASTDNTEKILRKYKKKNNFKVIRNKTNVGVGISRKIGIENANGEYITFLDSDDYLISDFIDTNIKLIKQHDSDVVYTSIEVISPLHQKEIIQVGNYFAENEATLNIFFWCQMNFITGKLFKTELLRKCKWSNRRIAEDVQTLFYIMYEAKKVRSFPYVGYVHVCREGSLMSYNSKQMNEEETLKHSFHNFCYNCIAEKEMLEFLMEKNDQVIFKPMYEAYFKKVKQTREYIKKQTLPKEIYLENKYLWDEVDNFYPKDT